MPLIENNRKTSCCLLRYARQSGIKPDDVTKTSLDAGEQSFYLKGFDKEIIILEVYSFFL